MVLFVEVGAIGTGHAVVLDKVEHVAVACDAFIGGFVEEGFLLRTVWFTALRDLLLQLFDVAVVVNCINGTDICSELLLTVIIDTLPCYLIKVLILVAIPTIVLFKVPIFRKLTLLTLRSIKIPPVTGAFWVSLLVLWYLTNKILSVDHVSVEKFLTDQSVTLALF